MENYTKVEVTSYVRQGTIGETVISWSVDNQGNEIQEKVAHVQVDDKTSQPG